MTDKDRNAGPSALKVNNFANDELVYSYYDTDEYDGATTHEACARRFNELRYNLHLLGEYDMRLSGSFDEDEWGISNDIGREYIRFTLNEERYYAHGYNYLDMDYDTAKDCMKCYISLMIGTYIAKRLIEIQAMLTYVLENIGEEDVRIKSDMSLALSGFLAFAGVGYPERQDIYAVLRMESEVEPGSRELAHLINYLAIDEEITALWPGFNDEQKVRWFPVYFWAKVTFVLPLRVTETCLTPYDCIRRDDDGIYLRVKRTQLKKGRRVVHYAIAQDYAVFEYRMPDNEVVKNIEWYRDVTSVWSREELFVPPLGAHRYMGPHLNNDINSFIGQYLRHTHKYDFAKTVSGLEEFERVRAGDARHIALSNLLWSDASIDVCRQLANQEQIDTTAGYAANVKNTLRCSTLLSLQRRINSGLQKKRYPVRTDNAESACRSPRRQIDPEDISDCEKYGQLSTCIGCPLYVPSKDDIASLGADEEEKLLTLAQDLQDVIMKAATVKGKEEDMKNALLLARSEAARYKALINMQFEQEAERWLEGPNSTIVG